MDPKRFVTPIPNHFLCGICHLVVQDPVEHNDCEHLFCQECLQSLSHRVCPNCRGRVQNKIKPMHHFVREYIYEKLEIRCMYALEGCRTVLPWNQLPLHEVSCPFKRQVLECRYCHEFIEDKTVTAAGTTCSTVTPSGTATAATTTTDGNAVTTTNNRHSTSCLHEHYRTTCSMYPIPCTVPGCTMVVPRGQLQEHYRLYSIEHVAMFQKKQMEYETEIVSLNQRMDELIEANTYYKKQLRIENGGTCCYCYCTGSNHNSSNSVSISNHTHENHSSHHPSLDGGSSVGGRNSRSNSYNPRLSAGNKTVLSPIPASSSTDLSSPDASRSKSVVHLIDGTGSHESSIPLQLGSSSLEIEAINDHTKGPNTNTLGLSVHIPVPSPATSTAVSTGAVVPPPPTGAVSPSKRGSNPTNANANKDSAVLKQVQRIQQLQEQQQQHQQLYLQRNISRSASRRESDAHVNMRGIDLKSESRSDSMRKSFDAPKNEVNQKPSSLLSSPVAAAAPAPAPSPAPAAPAAASTRPLAQIFASMQQATTPSKAPPAATAQASPAQMPPGAQSKQHSPAPPAVPPRPPASAFKSAAEIAAVVPTTPLTPAPMESPFVNKPSPSSTPVPMQAPSPSPMRKTEPMIISSTLSCESCDYSDMNLPAITIAKPPPGANSMPDNSGRVSAEYSTTLTSHTNSVSCLIHSNSLNRLYSGSSDNTIKVWDTTPRGNHSGNKDSNHQGHPHCSSPMMEQKQSEFDKDDSSPILLTTLQGHQDYVICLAISESHDKLYSGSQDKTIMVWDTLTNTHIMTLSGHKGHIYCLSIYGNCLYSGSVDKTIRIWDTNNYTCVSTLSSSSSSSSSSSRSSDSHSIFCLAVLVSPNLQRLYSGSSKTIKVWDTIKNVCVGSLQGHTDSVTSLVVANNNNNNNTRNNNQVSRLFSGSYDNTIKVWDTTTDTCMTTLLGHFSAVYCLVLSANNDRLFSGSWDRTIKLWDIEDTMTCIGTLEGHSHLVLSVALSSYGDRENNYNKKDNKLRLYSGSFDSTIKVWDMSTTM